MIYTCFTFDVERDWRTPSTMYLDKNLDLRRPVIWDKYSFSFCKKSMPKFLEIFKKNKIAADFFITKEVAENEAKLIENMLSEGHSLGVHVHPYSDMEVAGKFKLSERSKDLLETYEEESQRKMIARCKKSVYKYQKTKLFRSGKVSFNATTLKIIKELGFKLDSSVPKQKGFFLPRFWKNNFSRLKPFYEDGILRVPHFIDPSSIGINQLLRRLDIIKKYNWISDPLVVAFLIHPSVYGDPKVKTRNLFSDFELLVNYLKKNNFNMLSFNNLLTKSSFC